MNSGEPWWRALGQQEQPGPEVQAGRCVKGIPGVQRNLRAVGRKSLAQELHKGQVTKVFNARIWELSLSFQGRDACVKDFKE